MNELEKRAKAHSRKQKGMSPFSSLNPNAGDENINTQAFNSAMGGGMCEDFIEDNEYDDEVGEYFNAYKEEEKVVEEREGHKVVKVNTKSHYANAPFFWDLYDYAEDHDIDVDYEERKDREGNYYVTRFELYGLSSDIDKMFNEFKDLKKNCKVYNA